MRRQTPTNPPPIVRSPTFGRHTITAFDSSNVELGAAGSAIGSESDASSSAGTASSPSVADSHVEGSDPDFLTARRTSQFRPLVSPDPSSTTRSKTKGRFIFWIIRTQSPICVMLGAKTISLPSRWIMSLISGIRSWADGMSKMAYVRNGLTGSAGFVR